MEAHFSFRLVALSMFVLVANTLQGAQFETTNFSVDGAPTMESARQFCETAEQFRYDMAVLWLGKPMPDWSARCPIRVQVGDHLGAGGATTFIFHNKEVYGWEMDIQGSAKRILDSVLPHEITHMVLASHFRRPVPRWIDEGAATSVEHHTEKENYRRMLLRFLRKDTNKGLPFRQMVSLKEYPSDPMPFYAQSFSVIEYLLTLGDHRRLVAFAETGMETGDWDAALQKHYEIENLGQLQAERWIEWVRLGSPSLTDLQAPILLASGSSTGQSPESSIDPISLVSAKPSPPYGQERSIYERTPPTRTAPPKRLPAVIPIPTSFKGDTSRVVPIPTSIEESAVVPATGTLSDGWIGIETEPMKTVIR